MKTIDLEGELGITDSAPLMAKVDFISYAKENVYYLLVASLWKQKAPDGQGSRQYENLNNKSGGLKLSGKFYFYPRIIISETFIHNHVLLCKDKHWSFLAINRRGCNVNSPEPRTCIGRVGHADLMYISSTLNHFCSLVMVNPKKISAVANSWELLKLVHHTFAFPKAR